MRLMDVLRRCFLPIVKDQKIRSREEVGREIARNVVRSTSTGNYRLHRGQYVTRRDLDRELERVKEYRFDE